MPEETITFELIRKVHLEEQKSPTLTRIPTNFFHATSNYINQKKQLDIDDRKASLELRSVERLIEDIFNRRERKILNAAIISARTGLPPENLSEEERPFYNSIVAMVKNRRHELLSVMMPDKRKESMAIFKEDTPEFVGSDEQTYGPFKIGDTSKLPEDDMRILLERGVVEELK
ncbi:MAG: DNA replication complex GINS family protein [Candidatus Aenigmarchaeota archaeon]|nr:DNA replication complex GINS family protein [Candidatus Aenigmarchaeota archaeon]